MEKRALTEEQKSILKQCLWDMNLTPEEFLDIIEGRSKRKRPERAFCVARLLESVNWFKIVKVVEPRVLCKLWQDAKKNEVSKKALFCGRFNPYPQQHTDVP